MPLKLWTHAACEPAEGQINQKRGGGAIETSQKQPEGRKGQRQPKINDVQILPLSLHAGRRTLVERLRAGFELELGEAGVKAILGDEGLVAAFLDQPAIVENENPVGLEDGGEPMRDHEGRALRHHPFEGGLNHGLVFGIERRCRFVEKQDRRFLQNSPCDGNPLPLRRPTKSRRARRQASRSHAARRG